MSGTPKRIQLRRSKGWRKPEGTIVVTRPSKWGNPFRVRAEPRSTSEVKDAQAAVDRYRRWLTTKEPGLIEQAKVELAGHDLACWCRPGAPCHADVLLEVANG